MTSENAQRAEAEQNAADRKLAYGLVCGGVVSSNAWGLLDVAARQYLIDAALTGIRAERDRASAEDAS